MGRLTRAGMVALLVLAFAGGVARANPRAEQKIREHTAKAMEHFDTLEYELAKKLLLEAIVIAKRNRLAQSRVLADTYLHLGIVYFSGFEDLESAKLAFMDAVAIDRNVELNFAYRTDEMKAMLEEVKAEAGATAAAGADCASLKGVSHAVIDMADPGVAQTLTADVSKELEIAKVSVHYRQDGKTKYTEVKMSPVGECSWQAEIPAEAVDGPWLHYYVAAHDKTGRVLAASGSRQSPHLVEVEIPDVLGGGGGGGGGGGNGGTITRPVTPTPVQKKTVFLSIAVGTGGGYVNGSTEQADADVGCCFAPAVFHVFPEIGYYLSPQLSVSAAFRMGFPLDANREEHSTGAPSGVARVRYALDETGNGLLVNGAVGYGVIRHTVQLSMVGADEGDTDTSASGPLLVGTGAGYARPLGGPMTFLAELNVLAGVPVVDSFSGVDDPSFAVQFDFNLGLLVAF